MSSTPQHAADPIAIDQPSVTGQLRQGGAAEDTPSLLGHWYASGPEDVPFVPGHPDFNVLRIIEDDPAQPVVIVENDAGQQFPLAREFARSIAIAPIEF